MNPLLVARSMAVGRVCVGAVLMARPQWCTPLYVRRDDFGSGDRLFARMTGARDLGLGLGVLGALRGGAPLRGWLAAGILADATDMGAAAVERDRLAPTALPLFIATAGAGALMGVYALARADA